MPLDTAQFESDVEFLTSQAGWQNPDGRREYIRNVAVKSLQDEAMDPQHHAAVIGELWKRSDDRGAIKQALDWTGTAVGEFAKSIPSAGAAAVFAASDALNLTDTGSGVRVKRGLAGTLDAAGQRLKAFDPNDRQEQRDFALSELKKDLDARSYPEGLEAWVAGHYDGSAEKPDEETEGWINALGFGLGRKAVAANYKGEVDKEKVRAWVSSDRNPWRAESDTEGPGPRKLLGDYLVTRDPASWEAFAARVSETDAQHTTRLERYAAEGKLREGMTRLEDGSFLKDQARRAVEFQGSPIDIATTMFPFLKGAKAFQAAKAGSKGKAAWEATKGALGEGVSEGLTEALSDPNAPTAQVVNAAGMGVVGSGAMTSTAAGVGQLFAPKSPPTVSPEAVASTAPGTSVGSPLSPGAADGGGGPSSPQSPSGTPTVVPEGVVAPSTLAGIATDAGRTAVPVPASEAAVSEGAAGIAVSSPLPSQTLPPQPGPAPAASAEGLTETGASATATPEPAVAQPVELSPRARMAQRILENQGVEPAVAAHMATVLDEESAGDLPAEDFRAAVLGGFEERGGRFPGRNESGAVLNTDPAYWEALGHSPEQAREAAKNSQDWVDEDGRAAAEQNRTLLQPAEPTPGQGKGLNVSMMKNRRSGQGGFVQLPKGLADAMEHGTNLIKQGVTDFAKWSAAMVKRFGEAVREYLQGVWEAATKTSQSGFVLNPAGVRRAVRTGTTMAPGERSRVGYQGSGPYRVQNGIKRAILKGTTLPREFAEAMASTRDEVEAVKNAASRVARDLDGELRRQAGLGIQTREQLETMVNEALDDPAQMALLGALNAPLHAAAVTARNMLDQLSAAIAAQAGGQSGQTIMSNLGTWMRRSYMAFDPSTRWNLDNLRSAAAAGRNLNGRPARDILRDAEAYLRAQTPGLTALQLEYQLRRLTDRTVWMGVLTNDPNTRVTKDVSSLMRRRDIAPEIRALMGEVRDPLARFAKSADWQAQFIARHQMQSRMRGLGLRMGIFSHTPQGVYTVQVGGEDGPTRPWSGFGDDLYTTPEMMEALRSAQGVMSGTDLGGWFLNTIKFLGGEAKLNKVALNPDSWMVNLFGNVVGLVSSGDLVSVQGWRNVLRSWYQTRQAGRRIDFLGSAADRAAIEAARELQARLEAAGVLNGGFDMQDLMANLNNTVRENLQSTRARDAAVGAVRGAMVGGEVGGIFGGVGRAVGATVGAAAGAAAGGRRIVEVQKRFAEWLISKPDNFAKTVAYLNNFESYMRSGMTAGQAHARATEIVRDTLPDYSKLPGLARELSRFGVLGSFIGFQMEVYRNVFHNIRYGAQELRTGNPELMKRGASRLLGVSSMLTLGGWAAVSALLFGKGEDDEKDEAYRRSLARPWDANSPLVYEQLDGRQAKFWNMGYLIPQSTIFDLVRGAMAGRDFEESLGNAYDVMTKQFADGGVHTNPILEAVMNSRRGGGKVSYSEGALMNAFERIDHARRAIFTPGYVDKAQRVGRAALERQRGDRVYTIAEELKRLLGLRQSTYTHDESIAGRLFAFRDRADNARQVAKLAYNEWGKGKPDRIGKLEQMRALEKANAARAQIEADYNAWRDDLSKLGIGKYRVERIMKERSASFSTEPLLITRDGVVVKKR